MENIRSIKLKLSSFIRKYYFNELIKGSILFAAIGLLYFILTLLIEYFLWLDPLGRSILFWSFILVEAILLLKFIIVPLLKLLRLSKGLDHAQASRIIGDHFPKVNDKLLNLLQLKNNEQQSELLLASIDQKAQELQPVPFKLAVDFKKNIRFLRYMAIPVIFILFIYFTGNSRLFADSYERVVNYKMAFEPPAPFSFQVLNQELEVQENESFNLKMRTIGEVVPENASIHYNGQTYFLTSDEPGHFEFVFESLEEPVEFYFFANEVRSQDYEINVLNVPRVVNFEMVLDYPNYTGIKNEVLQGSGNATIPEGTQVSWKIETSATREVAIILADTTQYLKRNGNEFSLNKGIYQDLSYEVVTSNAHVKNYEELSYAIKVIKDEFPELVLRSKLDSIDMLTRYFQGTISDDYGISKLNLVYFPQGSEENSKIINIPVSESTFDEFVFSFPGNLVLQKGVNYEYYFELFDNDALRNPKSIKSRRFDFRRKTDEELEEHLLGEQKEAIQDFGETLTEMELSEEELEEISISQKEEGSLSYEERQRLQNFLKRQQQQNALLKNYTEKLQKGLEEKPSSEENEFRKQLQERLSRTEERLKENEKLLEELEKYTDKIKQEELVKKLENLSRKNQNNEKNLEQLLELTKRYYVQEKARKISEDLSKLAQEQNALSEKGEKNTKQKQDSLNREFNKIQEALENLEDENEGLKEPMEIGRKEALEREIQEEQSSASKNLRNQEKSKAQKNQQKAAEKMNDLSQKMQEQMQASLGEQLEEDAEMLRQILDNLLVFSFEQERLLEAFQGISGNNPSFAQELRRQNALKEHFEHVDDSLYSLALRNPMITESITDKLGNVQFNLDNALERFSQSEIGRGIASQQYVITNANDLAYYLSQILGNMQQMMKPSGMGDGRGDDMQLPDIIKKQGEINQQMQDGLQKRKNAGELEGKQQGKNGMSEEEMGRLYEIFQQQQMLRKALEEKVKKNGAGKLGDGVKEQMKQIEDQILSKGFNEATLKRMMQLEHKLLELNEALLRQGAKSERKSNAAKKEFENPVEKQIQKAKEYFGTTEILNRQSLPLRQIYKKKVKEYFERGDH